MPWTHLPTLRQLRAFACVAKTGSVGTAASLLGLSQPAVTQALSKLECSLGVILLNRTRNGSFPTAGGEEFLPYVKNCFQILTESLRDLFQIEAAECVYGKPSKTHKLTDTHLRSLLAIVEEASLEAAAQRLEITTASVLRSARDLEQLLGHELFRKSISGLRPNDTAKAFAERIHLTLQQIQRGIQDLKDHDPQKTMRLQVGNVAGVMGQMMGALVAEFLTLHPTAQIDLREERFETLLAELRLGKLDILICNSRLPDDIQDVDEYHFIQDEYCIVARKNHPLTQSESELTLFDLSRYPWTLPPAGAPRFDSFCNLFAGSQHNPKVCVESTSASLQRILLENSDCLTILTEREAVMEQTSAARLEMLPFANLKGADLVGYAVRKGWTPSYTQRDFIDLLTQHCKAMATKSCC